jgi:hypothetical protein
MEMIPHERSLVKRMAGKPFALLGVNTDETRRELLATIKDKDITWRSWWDKDGAIAEAWHVRSFPWLVLIDHKGMMRKVAKGPPDEKALDRAVDELVKEAEADAGKAP